MHHLVAGKHRWLLIDIPPVADLGDLHDLDRFFNNI
jgi:hypothetical protein